MRVLTLVGVGRSEPDVPLLNNRGYGRVPFHAVIEGAATFSVSGRDGPYDDWEPLLEDVSADTVGAMPFKPYLRFEITSGTGRVTLWIAEG